MSILARRLLSYSISLLQVCLKVLPCLLSFQTELTTHLREHMHNPTCTLRGAVATQDLEGL